MLAATLVIGALAIGSFGPALAMTLGAGFDTFFDACLTACLGAALDLSTLAADFAFLAGGVFRANVLGNVVEGPLLARTDGLVSETEADAGAGPGAGLIGEPGVAFAGLTGEPICAAGVLGASAFVGSILGPGSDFEVSALVGLALTISTPPPSGAAP